MPRELDLRGLAAREASISGVAAITDLGRLMSAGVGLVAPASAAFEFRRDEEGRYVVEAQITAEVVLECQRCLGEMTQLLETRTVMACIWDDEDAAQLPPSYEPLIVQETANLSDIVEEELLLAIPLVRCTLKTVLRRPSEWRWATKKWVVKVRGAKKVPSPCWLS